MRGSDFVSTYKGKGAAAWESAALAMARAGTLLSWPLVPVTFSGGGHTLVLRVASDYLAVGEPGDVLRLPLTPLTAQKIADVFGMLLPTPKMVKTIHEQAQVRTETVKGIVPNKYADLAQYAEQSANVDRELAGAGREGQLVSGHKKDVTIGNLLKPGKVLIYGWMSPEVPPGKDPAPMVTLPWRIQPYSSVHGADYVDYSHGIRLVSPDAVLDGQPVKVADVLTSPLLASLLSDEGPLRQTRYDVKRDDAVVPYIPASPRLVDEGLAWVQEQTLEKPKN